MNKNEILTAARNMLNERTESLKKDCEHCLFKDHPAPFPALLYCFSVIDLLGSLYAGDAKSSSGITKRALDYMINMMSYPKEKAELLQKVFRHKIVHLAQPNPKTKHNGRVYLWWLCHEKDYEKHFIVNSIKKSKELIFQISVASLVDDIANSVFRPNGYLHRLEMEPDLQSNFQTAYKQIFS